MRSPTENANSSDSDESSQAKKLFEDKKLAAIFTMEAICREANQWHEYFFDVAKIPIMLDAGIIEYADEVSPACWPLPFDTKPYDEEEDLRERTSKPPPLHYEIFDDDGRVIGHLYTKESKAVQQEKAAQAEQSSVATQKVSVQTQCSFFSTAEKGTQTTMDVRGTQQEFNDHGFQLKSA